MALLVLNELTKRCAAIVSAGETIQKRFLPLVVLRLGQGKNNTIVVGSSKSRCAVYSTVDNAAGLGKRSVAAAAGAKAIEQAKLTRLVRAIVHFLHRARRIRACVIGCAVNIEVAIHHQIASGLFSAVVVHPRFLPKCPLLNHNL
jgi:hypothetical protein